MQLKKRGELPRLPPAWLHPSLTVLLGTGHWLGHNVPAEARGGDAEGSHSPLQVLYLTEEGEDALMFLQELGNGEAALLDAT